MTPPNLPERQPEKPAAPPEGAAEKVSAPVSNAKPSLSARLSRWLPRKRDQTGGINISGGDVRVAGDLVAGDKIVNIGSIVVPVRFIAALVGLFLVAALGVWYVITPDKIPSSGNAFKIAVADFGKMDAQGNVTASSDASTWSAWMFNTLRDEAAQLPPDRKVVIWHDSMFPLQMRAHIGVIQGKTPAEREAAAEQKASELGADMLIYGNFSTSQTPATFAPEFYLAKSRNEADEMRGSQQMGKAFPAPSSLDPSDALTNEYLNQNLKPRAAALVWFVRGLLADLSGSFENAYQLFGDGLTKVPELQDDQGKAVFYYFLGQEALFLSQDEKRAHDFFQPTSGTGADAALERAEKWFREAIEIDENYARAYFGLGSVFYQRANLIMTNTFPEDAARVQVAPLLEQAIALHQRALELAPLESGSLIAQQARLQLGFDYYQQGRAALDAKKYAEAEQALNQAQAELERGLGETPVGQHRIRAQVFATLATTAYLRAHARVAQSDSQGARQNFTAAEQAFTQCISETNLLVEDKYLQTLKADCARGAQTARQELAKLN